MTMHTIIFDKDEASDVHIFVDGVKLDLNDSLKIRNHSPSGFSIGYEGSGPTQSALAILLHVLGEDKAVLGYQQFKREFLSRAEYFNKVRVTIRVDIQSWFGELLKIDEYAIRANADSMKKL